MSQYTYSNNQVRVKLDHYWYSMWQGLGLAGTGNTIKFDLIGNYEKRSYHNIQHLLEMFVHYQNYKPYLGNKYEVLAAIWFHDAIYEPGSITNEERSAEWAFEVTKNHKVAEIIMMSDMDDYDTAIFHDFDYSILATDWDRFSEYEKQIRQEYKNVSDVRYNEGRVTFLRKLLSDRIFENYKFNAKYEAKAKNNISILLEDYFNVEAYPTGMANCLVEASLQELYAFQEATGCDTAAEFIEKQKLCSTHKHNAGML